MPDEGLRSFAVVKGFVLNARSFRENELFSVVGRQDGEVLATDLEERLCRIPEKVFAEHFKATVDLVPWE